MEINKIQAYGYTSDVEAFEKHKKKLSKAPAVFYSMSIVSRKTGIGRTAIYSLLREHNCIDDNNIPNQNYVTEGYFEFYILNVKDRFRGVVSASPKGIYLILDLYENQK